MLALSLELKYIGWSIFHRFGIFQSPHYRVLLIRHAGALVHRSCLVPKYFRWPFMGDNDLQVTSTWTVPAYRGRGLATYALQHILESCGNSGRCLWYVTRESNPASIAVCRKVIFELTGRLRRTSPLRVRLLGAFRFSDELLK